MSDEKTTTEPSGADGGSQPVAWAALNDDRAIAWIGYTEEGAADGACGRTIVPLYRQEPPTDAELDAICWAADTLCVGWDDLNADDKDRSRKAADTLRWMVARLS
jgi:hypothetical protein